MKIGLALIVAFALALVIGAACQVDNRSDEFRCPTGVCDPGRTCVDGWCVTGDGGGIADAAGDGAVDDAMIDGTTCPSGCDECTGGRCLIHCDAPGKCPSQVICPPGVPCVVDCTDTNACPAGVDCSAASTCEIDCNGAASCAGAMICGNGRCLVSCAGQGSCAGSVNCNSSCKCDVSCPAGSCVGSSNDCPGPNQCDTGAGCTSAPNPCHSC